MGLGVEKIITHLNNFSHYILPKVVLILIMCTTNSLISNKAILVKEFLALTPKEKH